MAAMKVFGYALVILVMGFLGYALYPNIRPTLENAGWIAQYVPQAEPAPAVEPPATDDGGEAAVPPAVEPVPVPEPAPGPAPAPAPAAGGIPQELVGLTPDRLPERVLLKAAVTVRDPSGEVEMQVPAGQRVKPLRVEGAEVVVSPGGQFEGRLAAAQTDLVEQIRLLPPAPVPPAQPPPVADNPPPVPAPVPQPEPVPAPEPAPVVQPQPAVEPVPGPAPEPVVEPVVEPVPEPVPPGGAGHDEPGIVKAMQQSIRSGQIQEFKFEQVLGWKAGPEEEVDGEKYQTGLVAYKAETIFGVKNIQAKALIKDGQVIRWIWPKSGMEIR